MSDAYEKNLLKNWEEVYRQGLLTFWSLLALYNRELSIAEIRSEIELLTNGTYKTSDQALYRLLRKHYDLEMVNMREISGNGGPNKKLYSLSDIGMQLLIDFTQRNITLFSSAKVQNIINKGANNENI
jgi:DNA-binding PadR family transcriptional regulator